MGPEQPDDEKQVVLPEHKSLVVSLNSLNAEKKLKKSRFVMHTVFILN